MRQNVVIAIVAGLLMVLIGLLVISFKGPAHYPRDLSYWISAAAARDWSSRAAQGEPRAQLCCGLNLIRSNLVIMKDQVVLLSALPLIGKRFFESTSYNIDNMISQEQLTEAYGWVRKAVDQGFAPARKAEKLFIGRVAVPNQGGAANKSRLLDFETNRAAAAGSPRLPRFLAARIQRTLAGCRLSSGNDLWQGGTG